MRDNGVETMLNSQIPEFNSHVFRTENRNDSEEHRIEMTGTTIPGDENRLRIHHEHFSDRSFVTSKTVETGFGDQIPGDDICVLARMKRRVSVDSYVQSITFDPEINVAESSVNVNVVIVDLCPWKSTAASF
jgi:hypothetical protein